MTPLRLFIGNKTSYLISACVGIVLNLYYWPFGRRRSSSSSSGGGGGGGGLACDLVGSCRTCCGHVY